MGAALAGKVALVTGGGSGIGEAIARGFAAEGAKVALCGRRPAEIGRVAGEIGGLAIPADVSVESDIVRLFDACDRAFGGLDVLVNNAGLSGPTAAAEAMDMAAWDEIYAVNVRAVILCIKHAIPLLKRRGGSIVNMSSRVAFRPNPFRSAYASTKFALRAITESVAHEVGPYGIRVNALCPGAVDTALFRRIAAERAATKGVAVDDYVRSEYENAAALRKLVSLGDVVAAAVFLAGDASASMTGESIKIDAGRP